jgi:hypothetical protein
MAMELDPARFSCYKKKKCIITVQKYILILSMNTRTFTDTLSNCRKSLTLLLNNILWHLVLLLDNDGKMSKYTTAVGN